MIVDSQVWRADQAKPSSFMKWVSSRTRPFVTVDVWSNSSRFDFSLSERRRDSLNPTAAAFSRKHFDRPASRQNSPGHPDSLRSLIVAWHCLAKIKDAEDDGASFQVVQWSKLPETRQLNAATKRKQRQLCDRKEHGKAV
eukprot:scpid30849/ scgid15988/ 